MSNSSKDQKFDEGYAAGFADGLRSCQEQKQMTRTVVQTNRRSSSDDNNRTFTNTIKKTRLSNELPSRRVVDKRNVVTNTKREIVRPGLIESTNSPVRRVVEQRFSKPDEHDVHEKYVNPVRGSIENPFQQRDNRTYQIHEQEIQRKYPTDNRTYRVVEQEVQRKYPNENRPYRPEEHEMEGRNTLPDTEVKIESHGRY